MLSQQYFKQYLYPSALNLLHLAHSTLVVSPINNELPSCGDVQVTSEVNSISFSSIAITLDDQTQVDLKQAGHPELALISVN